MSRREAIQYWLPVLLFIPLGAIMLVTVFTQAKNYGITMDVPLQDSYGHSILAWYRTLGRDTSFLTAYPVNTYMPEHGAIFDAIIALAQHIFGHYWYTRAVMTGLAGIGGIIAIALCGYEIGGWWCAFVAALGLWLYPRYFGAIFNNPKDIPFAAAMTWILWSVLLLVKHWKTGRTYYRYCMLVGFCIGFAASIRVTAVIWYLLLLLIAVGWWFINGMRIWHQEQIRAMLTRQTITALVTGLTSLLTMMALWPYIFLNPIVHLYDSISVMSRYPWNGTVLFNGVTYPAAQLPYSYVPTWLIIGSPPILIVCAVLGSVVACITMLRKREADPKIMIVLLAFFVPFASLIVLHTTLYNALRQFLFIVPPMILIAAYGINTTIRVLISQRKGVIAAGLAIVLLISYGFVVADMISLHPYEYVYFSPIAGSLQGAARNYETDYYASCDKAAAQWLAQNYQRYTRSASLTVEGIMYFEPLITIYLPGNFHIAAKNPDFYVVPVWASGGKSNAYHTIYVESRQGIPFCSVQARN